MKLLDVIKFVAIGSASVALSASILTYFVQPEPIELIKEVVPVVEKIDEVTKHAGINTKLSVSPTKLKITQERGKIRVRLSDITANVVTGLSTANFKIDTRIDETVQIKERSKFKLYYDGSVGVLYEFFGEPFGLPVYSNIGLTRRHGVLTLSVAPIGQFENVEIHGGVGVSYEGYKVYKVGVSVRL